MTNAPAGRSRWWDRLLGVVVAALVIQGVLGVFILGRQLQSMNDRLTVLEHEVAAITVITVRPAPDQHTSMANTFQPRGTP